MSASHFVIMDPSLRDFRGHHYMLTDLASRSAELAGMRVTWLAADPVPETLNRQNVTLAPWFSMSMYDPYKPAAVRPAPARVLARLGAMLPGRRPDRAEPLDAASVLAPELSRAFARFDDGDCDTRFFAHTADGAVYRAMGALADEIAANDRLRIHLCTPYDPVGVMPNRGPGKDIEPAIERLMAAGVLGRQVFLHAENPFLAAHLSDLWRTPVSTLEIPVDDAAARRAENRRSALRREMAMPEDALVIASLGPARLEKGFDRLPEIIRCWRALEIERSQHDEGARPVRFALHAAPQIIGRHPAIAKAINELAAQNDGSVTILEESLSDEDYAAVLDVADAVIMPYDAEMYRVRSSGAAVEALAAGKIIIATEGSYPARRIAPGAGETAADAKGFADAIGKIASNPASYRAAAARAAERYGRDNALSDYVAKIIRAETSSPPKSLA